MNYNAHRDRRILAIDPGSRGFGFAVLEGTALLVDWGVCEARGTGKNQSCLAAVEGLLARYLPDVLVVENHVAKGSRRCTRIEELVWSIALLASKMEVRVYRVPRSTLKKASPSIAAAPKHATAQAIAAAFPELALRVPPPRKPWMTEDYRTGIFDAVALALAVAKRRADQRAA